MYKQSHKLKNVNNQKKNVNNHFKTTFFHILRLAKKLRQITPLSLKRG